MYVWLKSDGLAFLTQPYYLLCIVDSPKRMTSAFRNIRAAKAKMISTGMSLVVQWLRLQAPNTGNLGSIPGQGTRSHVPKLRPEMLQQRYKDPHEPKRKLSTAKINKYFFKKFISTKTVVDAQT